MNDHEWLHQAIDLSRQCPVSTTAYSVGAVIVADGRALATGYSRQEDPLDHAEEVALRHLGDADVSTATIYTSLEPCGRRASRPRPCADRVIDAGIRRVVYAWAEPDTFVIGTGAAVLRAAGVTVVHLAELAEEARAVNAHL
ncbi:deaminase [Stackebrandtia soli]|uniref:deaminase n=1 Tax=Stackebrandtia soli TaxID=1892856 RepID=UPI0039EB6EC3